ncbi:hypothetical protein CQW23_02717 [Capsicum baccatum]|uniref:Uncharacterized protein n=1 Tax=Capsicum baccatum TaxID=33114 RepID=A0A2G2XS82_CAPBA|nr:hypothetical protein CQW23_02717 [Capsicum baccatum]PHT99095.1 hypothetical protein BC332_31932 [Capsicum chinense]
MVFWSFPPTPKQLKFTIAGVAAGITLITAGAYLSYSNIAPQQARAKARKDYIKARLKQLVQD